MKRLDLGNRAVVLVLAVVLLLLGGVGLARSYGALDDEGGESDPLLLPEVQDFVADNDAWFWLVAFAVALLVAWLGWRWLRVQLLPTPSLGTLSVALTEDGHTTIPSRAVSAAVTRDLEDDPDVRSARVRIVGSQAAPALDVRASVADTAETGEVRDRVEERILGRARAALERSDLTATVRYRLGDPTERAVG